MTLGRGFALLGMLLLLMAGIPAVGEVHPGAFPSWSAAAQTSLSEREARYLTARSAYNAALRELAQASRQYELAKDAFLVPARRGSDREAQEAFATYISRAQQLQALEVRERELREELETARRSLIQGLDAREAELLDRLEGGAPPSVVAILNQQVVEVRRRLREVEREAEPIVENMVRPVPNLAVDPRDGPRELREKATFLEEVAASYDPLIQSLDQLIEERERRVRQERGQADLLADLSRFDADRLPGTGVRPDGPRSEEGRPAAEESEGPAMVFAERPLTEQIEMLRSIRDQAVRFQEDAMLRAENFRELAQGGRG